MTDVYKRQVQNSVAADIGLFGRAAGHAYAVLGAIRTGGNAHRAYDRQHKRGSDDLFEESFLHGAFLPFFSCLFYLYLPGRLFTVL